MSLFEKIKNIRRSNLQEKKIKFPGGTGDIGFTAPKRGEKVQKRLDRADKLGTPDPFDPDYDKKVKKVDKRTKIGKKVSSAFETPKKSDLKKLDKQPGGYRAPASAFGKGLTSGEFRVKQMQRRAFKITQPEDINDPTKKRFDQLSKEIKKYKSDVQDFKDRNLPGGPRKTSRTSFKGQGSGSRFDPGIGMAPPDKPKTKVVKQSEVSKNQRKFDKEINQARIEKTSKSSTKSKSDVNRIAQNKIDTQKADQFKKTDAYKNVAQGKDSQGNYLTPQQRKKNFKNFQSDLQKVNKKVTVGAAPDYVAKSDTGVTSPPVKKVSTGITKSGNISYATDPTKLGGMKVDKATQAIIKRETNKTLKLPQNVKYAVAASKRKGIARGFTRFLGKLGPKGRLAAAGATAFFATPMGRNFAKNLAVGGGLTAALGLAGKKEKVLKKGDGLKTVGKVNVRYGLTGTSKKGQGGKVYDPKQMAQLGKVQKNFIDKYNQKASRNPFKKQIQYKPKADGTYKILDPKKK